MEKCYYSEQYNIYTRINLICGVFIGSILILIAALVKNESLIGCITLFTLALSIVIHTGLFVTFLNRRYAVNEEGIAIQYANRHVVFYPWKKIELVCIGITHRSGTGTTQDTVIWCTTKKKKCPSPAESRRHTSWEYDYFHCNSVITIEFSEERYDQFARCYRENIPDYR